jgi:DNA replication and repair protein RecF
MYLKSVELANFRNYESLKIKLMPGINVFYGENGTGKTNIIESIYCTAMGRSFRSSEEAILVKQGRTAFSIALNAVENGIERDFTVDYDSSIRKKRVAINGNRAARLSQVVGKLPVVLFSPENIMMIKGEPSQRRRFLDDMLSQFEEEYFETLGKYLKEVAHRNYLLKGIREGRVKRENLPVWNEQVMNNGVKIILSRVKAVEELNLMLEKELASEKFRVHIAYSSKHYSNYDEKALKENFRSHFLSRTEDEITRAATLIGPHRDDLEIFYNGLDAKNFASEGQQRITSILIKLAEGLLMKKKKGSFPVVLLDDFSSELDEPNRGFIGKKFSLFKQILITTTYRENLRGFDPAGEFEVAGGVVKTK